MKIVRSFSYAWEGIKTCFASETNFKIHTAVTVLVIIFAIVLHIPAGQWMVLLFCITLVITMEMINTAIEKLCDLVQPGPDPVIKKIKDITAGAVLVATVCCIIIGLVIFLPATIHWIKNI